MSTNVKPNAFVEHNGQSSEFNESTKENSVNILPPSPSISSKISKHNDLVLLPSTSRALEPRSPNPGIMTYALLSHTPSSTNSQAGKVSASVPANDLAIAGLASRMQGSVIITDRAVQTPHMIHVPRGYRSTATEEAGPVDHFMAREEVRAHVKRKRAEGVLPNLLGQQSEKEMYGFNPQELNIRGAVSKEDCQPSTLTNDIHPLLDRSRFDDTPDAIYNQLIPALRLASMFLTQPAVMQFWVTLALAERRDDPETSQNYGRRCQRIESHVPMTTQNTTAVIKHLDRLANDDLIHFTFRHKDEMPDKTLWGCSAPIRSYNSGGSRELTKSIIRLHADYYIVAQKLSKLTFLEQSQQLRFSFLFAVLILHELAHSIEGAYIKMRHYQWMDFQNKKHYFEPFFFDWRQPPECGRTMEQILFGGEIHPINARIDGSHGICVSDWPPRGSLADSERRFWYTVPTAYIEDIFQMTTWQQAANASDWRRFHIPRTGAISLYIYSFTTMAWSEGERVAREDAAELLAIAKAQPAPKKRIVSSGEQKEQRSEEKEVADAIVRADEVAKVEETRHVPVFSHTRRRSSVMPGALSDAPSATPRPPPSIPATLAEEPSSSQQAFPDKPNADDAVRSIVEISDSLPPHLSIDARPAENKEHQPAEEEQPTSELVKKMKKRPVGIWEAHKAKKKLDAEKRKTEALVKKQRNGKVDENRIEMILQRHEAGEKKEKKEEEEEGEEKEEKEGEEKQLLDTKP